ncbi:hypothetical protein, partial [Aliarcobacter butzleri]|uniref:hypothetical protein n=1 Tax=Aliarcobacter butzleri TaxID=28197 RepID=UPI003AF41D48
MADQKVNGQYLEKGIYFEAKSLFDGFGNTYHTYLVYRDGNGKAEVIRGGPEGFNELTVRAGVDISTTKDSYLDSPIENRIVTKLDLGNQDIEQVWAKAVSTANSIDPRIDYELNIYPTSSLTNAFLVIKNLYKENQIILSEDAQVCHSVTGTILTDMGFNIDDVLGQANMSKVSVNGIETNLLDIDMLDIGAIDQLTDYVSKVFNVENNDSLKEIVHSQYDKWLNENKTTVLDPITVEAHPELVVEIVNGVASLKSGQTISHVALNTKYTTKELLQYNGLTEEQAKKLPVGFVVKIPKDVDNVQGGYGNVKVYEGHDGSLTYHIPSDDKGNIKVVKISSNGEILRNDFDNNEDILDKGVSTILQEKLEELIADKNSVVFLKNKDNENTTDTEEKYSIVDVRHPDNVQRAKDEYHAKEALAKFSKGEDISLAEVIQAVEKSPTIMNKLKEVLIDKGNDDVASWITEDGKFKADTQPDIKERVFLEAEEGNQLSTKLGSSIGGGIGSIIIANNDYSNIEKLAISTSTTVIGQNVGEYLFWDSKNGNGTGAFGDIATDYKNTLQGAVVSFAISSFFAKNDNISDILGMDGTFVGGLVDYTAIFTTGYAINSFIDSYQAGKTISEALSQTTQSITSLADSFSTALGGAVGGYLGNALANEIMNWDTKEEAMGASIGSAIGTVTAMLLMNPATFWLGFIVAFGGSFIGNIVGGIIGGLFGGSKPPPPKAHAEYEFDEDSLSYNL